VAGFVTALVVVVFGAVFSTGFGTVLVVVFVCLGFSTGLVATGLSVLGAVFSDFFFQLF